MKSTPSRVAAPRCTRNQRHCSARRPVRSSQRWTPKWVLSATLTLPCALLLSPGAVSAEAQGLSLRQALANALSHNKQIAASAYQVAEGEGRLQQAGLLPNPQVSLIFENVGGGGIFRGFEGAETTLSLAWAIEPGLRGRRVGVAQARSAQVGVDVQILRLDVAAETAQRFLTCLESQAHLAATEEAVSLAEQTLVAIERRVRAGRAPNAELMRARAELATERLANDDVTHERSVAYYRLASQWGETTPQFSRVEGELGELPVVPSYDELEARIEKNPLLERIASEQRIAEARLRLAQARRWPTLTPTLGARKFELTGDWALVAGISAPLPVFDRNQGRVAQSRSAVAHARAEAEAERVRVRTTLFELYQEMQHSAHRAEVLRDEVIPRFEETIDETRKGYEKGRYRYFELRTVQAEVVAAKRSLVEASTAAHRLVITLERLTGEKVVR
jgi:cobalt-zinc-cadmium efflux system outer membrane protein